MFGTKTYIWILNTINTVLLFLLQNNNWCFPVQIQRALFPSLFLTSFPSFFFINSFQSYSL